jgi:hypothetical protein
MKVSSRLNNEGNITFELKSESSHEETLLTLVKSGQRVTTHFSEFAGTEQLSTGVVLAFVFSPDLPFVGGGGIRR